MSRITTMTFILAALGMTPPSIESLRLQGCAYRKGEADQRATGLAPPAYEHPWPPRPSMSVVNAFRSLYRAWAVPERAGSRHCQGICGVCVSRYAVLCYADK
jgi:hypothetical protein